MNYFLKGGGKKAELNHEGLIACYFHVMGLITHGIMINVFVFRAQHGGDAQCGHEGCRGSHR